MTIHSEPISPAAKQQLNSEKLKMYLSSFSCGGFDALSVWRFVGMTVTCSAIDVM